MCSSFKFEFYISSKPSYLIVCFCVLNFRIKVRLLLKWLTTEISNYVTVRCGCMPSKNKKLKNNKLR